MRGTKSIFSTCDFKNWITENKQFQSFVSKSVEQKIPSCKGTNTLWIKKKPKKTPYFPTKKVLTFDRGTR